MNQGKLEVVKEMARVNVDILGISELKWTRMGEFNSWPLYLLLWAGIPQKKWSSHHYQQMSPKCSTWMQSQNWQNDLCSFQGKPFNITVIQVYAPISNAEEAEDEWFYEDLRDLLELTPKKDVLFTIGDWNTKVGSQEILGVTGKFGFGIQNEAGKRLTKFWQENALVIENTFFQQNKRRLYTWTSPDGKYWNQIDYILFSQRWKSSIQSTKTRLGADCGSDHELFTDNFRLKFKKVGKTNRLYRYDLNKSLMITQWRW